MLKVCLCLPINVYVFTVRLNGDREFGQEGGGNILRHGEELGNGDGECKTKMSRNGNRIPGTPAASTHLQEEYITFAI